MDHDLPGAYLIARGNGWCERRTQVTFFNHQTHSSGQVHDMLSGCGVEPAPLDFLYDLPDPREG